jgi:protein-tyrosine phosphatase
MLPTIRHILILCEGNHCRSPLAEAMLQKALAPGIRVSSAGLDAMVGHPAHRETKALMAKAGIAVGAITAHIGRQVTADMALGADLILVMDQAQKLACERLAPSTRGRVFLLGHWLPMDQQEIPDPIRGGPETHRQAHDHIQRAIQAWLTRLAPKQR